ncbi:DoxX family protein [Lysinibacillus sp. NPDC093210]|uniref:DoxX family protein n=1 Tax=Lysinibacillus sp. NPDC093210 TaxID=3364133 RepID=UPI00382EE50F
MNIVSIILQTLLTLMFLMASFGKLRGAKTPIEEFNKLRLPQWFRVITGVIEFISAVALIIGYWDASWLAIGALLIACTAICGVLAQIRIRDSFKNMLMIIVIGVMAIFLFINNMPALLNFSSFK